MTESTRNSLFARLATQWSIEATPVQWRGLPGAAAWPQERCVYVPALPRSSGEDTAAACVAIRDCGHAPVPHLAARAMRSRAVLAEWLERMRGAGADALLLIAGDRGRAAGPFHNTLAVLDTGLIERFGFRGIGVAGHPEGHPKAGSDELVAALRCKATWARETGSDAWIVTQFVFSAAPVFDWYTRMRREEIGLPLRIGLAGPAKVGTLVRYAAQCGIGASARMLMDRPGALVRLAGQWAPDALLQELAGELEECESLPIAGVHVFPFGGLTRSIEFFGALRHHGAAMRRTAITGS